MKSPKPLMLTPLMMWTTQVFHTGRKDGLSDQKITECVKIYAKERGWQNSQITKVLRYNGIGPRKWDPLRIICPKCDSPGRLNSFSSNNHKPDQGRIHYYILHEEMRGKWGKTKPGKRRDTWGKIRLKKRRRCYFHDLFSTPEYLKPIAEQLFPISDYTD